MIATPAYVQLIEPGSVFIVPLIWHVIENMRFPRKIAKIMPAGRFVIYLTAKSTKNAFHRNAREIV